MEEKINIIRINYAKGISYNELMRHVIECNFNIDQNFIENIKHVHKNIFIPSKNDIEIELERNDKCGIKILTFKDNEYSEYLKYTDCYPFALHCKGNISILNSKKTVSMIGSRTTSINNFNYARTVAKELGIYGYIVIAGLAKGIDSASHIGALKTGTIAVLGAGVDNIYPRENKQLYNDIIENGGLIVSEFRTGTTPKPEFFLQRNRIIAGLSKGVVIVDAGIKSGTLNTANYALKFDREVMAFPGNPYDERYAGSNKLLKNGATMVTNASDIIENIESFTGTNDNFLLGENSFKYFTNLSNNNFIETDDLLETANMNVDLENILLSKLDFCPIDINEFLYDCENDENLKSLDNSTINSLLSKFDIENKIIINCGKINLKYNSN